VLIAQLAVKITWDNLSARIAKGQINVPQKEYNNSYLFRQYYIQSNVGYTLLSVSGHSISLIVGEETNSSRVL
jgi:hypothetical protein